MICKIYYGYYIIKLREITTQSYELMCLLTHPLHNLAQICTKLPHISRDSGWILWQHSHGIFYYRRLRQPGCRCNQLRLVDSECRKHEHCHVFSCECRHLVMGQAGGNITNTHRHQIQGERQLTHCSTLRVLPLIGALYCGWVPYTCSN